MSGGKFGLLGEKLSHSLSPQIHKLIGDYEYRLYPTPREELDGFFAGNALDGFNVTIPYKIEAMNRCAELSDAAAKTGSVNTVIKRSDGTYFGDNTDLFGFIKMAESIGCDFSGRKVLILGSGGASRTVQAAARDLGAGKMIVVSRSGENNYSNLSRHRDADIIINTTPVGMYPENGKSPVDLNAFPACRKVLDLIYNPSRTVLIQQAQALGIDCVNGLYMLAAQAVRSSSVFTGETVPDEKAAGICGIIEKNHRNILLIGMPGCGKTTAGKMLAEKLDRDFSDSDLLIEEQGESIPEIFEKNGEEEFRRRETEILRKICKESGRVISTGGGAVLKGENRIAMRENSLVIFLDSPVGMLQTEGRPLSRSREALEKIYNERIGLYRLCSDFTVSVSPDPDETLRRILKCVYL